jgi:predicted RNase H-like HicB family nuclease
VKGRRDVMMLRSYIDAAMRRARYEIIKDAEPYYGEIAVCPGVWAKADNLEECRERLESALEDWVFFSIARGLPLPKIGRVALRLPEPVKV